MSWKRTKCVILSCKAKLNDFPERRFFNFPQRDTENYVKWLNAIGISKDAAIDRKKPYVCSIHFESKFFGKKYLKKNTVPTLFLGNDDNIVEDEESLAFNPSNAQKTYAPKKTSSTFSAEDLNFAAKVLPSQNITDENSEILLCQECPKSFQRNQYYKKLAEKLRVSNKKLIKRCNHPAKKNYVKTSLI